MKIDGKVVFVLPAETIGRTPIGRVLLDGTAHGPYQACGTLAEWRDGIGALTAGHAIPALAVSTALAGPLLHLGGLEGGGVNLFGQSSRGKRHACKRPRAFGDVARHRDTFAHAGDGQWSGRGRGAV
jgi:uncharacterized protein (DUF927 family)